MGVDDDTDCPGHEWQLAGLRFNPAGAEGEYLCTRCGALLHTDMANAPWSQAAD